MHRGTNRTARRALAGLVAAAALIAPAQAGAAGAGVGNGTLGIASGSEASNITVTRLAGNLVVADPTHSLSAIYPCSTTGSPAKVICPAASVTSIVALMGDGDDRLDTSSLALPVTANGGNGNDRIATGAAADTIDGAAGADVFLARDGTADSVTCGTGADSGQVDAADTLSADCETAVERPAPPAGGPAEPAQPDPPNDGGAANAAPDDPPATGDGSGDDATDDPGDSATDAGDDSAVDSPAVDDAPVEITTPATIHLSPHGDFALPVACTAASGSCKGTIELIESDGVLKTRAVVASARSRRATKTSVVLARSSFTIPAGHKKNVRLRLDRRGRQRIIKKKKTKARIVITVSAPDGTVTTTEKSVTIGPPKERRTTKRGGAPAKTKRK
jgi:hypothetical protein